MNTLDMRHSLTKGNQKIPRGLEYQRVGASGVVLTGETVLGENPHVMVVPGRAAKFVGFRIN